VTVLKLSSVKILVIKIHEFYISLIASIMKLVLMTLANLDACLFYTMLSKLAT